MTVIKLADRVDTDFAGYKKLIRFYNECREYTNQTVHIDFYHLEWIDANLCALFEAIFYKLSKENNLQFATDLAFLESKFDVLFRNGFIQSDKKFDDVQHSTMPTVSFECGDKQFVSYVEKHLLEHRGMPEIHDELKEQIMEDLIEVFSNVHLHAQTVDPFFVSGQFYPKQRHLRFTMVDLGQGFLPKIEKATNGEIANSLDAIKWALNGNSSKVALENTPGGLGLSRILKYCEKHNGQLDIISGNGYWSSDYENTIAFKGGRELESPFVGTTINLSFKQ